MNNERIAFVTGRLAEFALRRLLQRLAPKIGFEYEVIVLDISVAALLTPPMVVRRLRLPSGIDRVLLPGYCAGDLQELRQQLGVQTERGPKDLRNLPDWFARGGDPVVLGPGDDYGQHAIEIIAEINHVPQLPSEEILRQAERYVECGADVIDLGCNPGETWENVGDAVRLLRDRGYRVAIDTFNRREIELAVGAGAELVLSVHGKNIEVVKDLDCEVVAIPDDPKTLAGLEETIAQLEEWKVPCRLDPIIEPVGFGFAESLGRYLEVRRRYPVHAMMMGIGNLTELTDVDSAGVNALLIGFCEELKIGSVLTTEVIHWAQSSVQEIDVARRLMHYAVSQKVLPKHVENGLILLRDPEVLEHGQEILEHFSTKIRDPNFRIFAERGEIHVMNRDCYLQGKNPFELFEQMEVEDVSHSFYLGYEMAKAVLALQLGKQYCQDQALRWGFLSVEEESHLDKKRERHQSKKRAGK